MGVLSAAALAVTASGVLPEGTVLRSVDGALVAADGNDVWFFELSDDVSDASVRVPAGTRLGLLPSRTLAQMIADANERRLPQYRIAAQVTRYQDRNYLLAQYYLPLSKLKDANEPATQMQTTPEPTQAGTSNGALVIPDGALELLRGRRPVRGPLLPAAPDAAPQERPNRMLVNLTGFVESHQGPPYFVPDGLGWSVSTVRYQLLPSRVLEQVQQTVAAAPNPVRFNVSGLVTEFRGVQYLILQRAVRVYHHGNFGD